MQHQWLVILNPVSGGMSNKLKQKRIADAINDSGLDLVWEHTKQKGDAIEIVKRSVSEGIRNIIVVGGDGTLNEVINGVLLQEKCASSAVKIAMFSHGTGNDFARSYHLPKKIDAAIQMLKSGSTKTIDAGWVSYEVENKTESRFFINILGMGFDGAVTDSANKSKQSIGRLTYLKAVLSTLMDYEPSLLKITIDNNAPIQEKVFTFNAGIGRFSGGGMKLVPHAVGDDGYLALTLMQPLSPIKALINLYRLFTGSIDKLKETQLLKGKEIHVAATPPIMAEAEGEFFGYSPFHIRVIPKAITIVVPK